MKHEVKVSRLIYDGGSHYIVRCSCGARSPRIEDDGGRGLTAARRWARRHKEDETS